MKASHSSVKVKVAANIIHAPNYELISILLKDIFVDEVYHFTTDNLQPIIIDCGANIGISALYFKYLYPLATIHCFEPYNDAFNYLKLNVEQNSLDGVYIYCKALSKKEGKIQLNIPHNGTFLNPSILRSSFGTQAETVSTLRLSSFLLTITGKIDLLKLDVEGAELEIVCDLDDNGLLMNGKIKKLIIEYHNSLFCNQRLLHEFIDILKDNEYDVSGKVLFPDNLKSDVLIIATHRSQPHC